MPASAGRTRMPHNNRMSTSGALATSDIWSKTIGHDPYANSTGERHQQDGDDMNEKAKGLLALARHQKVAGDTTSRDDFARKLYLGLKGGKKRRTTELCTPLPNDVRMVELLAQESSSEEEYVEKQQVVATERKKKKRKHSLKECKSSDESESSDESSKESRSKKKKARRERKVSRRSRSESSDEEPDSDSSNERKQRKRRKHRKEKKSHLKRKNKKSSGGDSDRKR